MWLSDTSRLLFGSVLLACIASGQVKTKLYTSPENCFKTYTLATGRVLTPRGLVEDPTVNAIMKDAVSAQMNTLKITATDKSQAQMEVPERGGGHPELGVIEALAVPLADVTGFLAPALGADRRRRVDQ